jgi:hypothetical protein
VFVFDELRIAESPDIGFVFPDGKVHNEFAPLGALENDQIRQGLLGGESLMLIELAGIDEPFDGDDDEVTVKLYRGIDADQPFFPANNFMIPQGETSCCQFLIDVASLEGDPPQARSRVSAKIARGNLVGLATNSSHPTPVELPGILLVWTSTAGFLTVGLPQISARVTPDIDSPPPTPKLHDGLLGGALTIHSLAAIENPYCRTVSDPLCPALIPDSTLIDLVAAMMQPDIDLDGDGALDSLKRDVLGNGRVGICSHGSAAVPPLMPMEPWTCALQPEMGDGFSISVEWEAVGAQVLGFGSISTGPQ